MASRYILIYVFVLTLAVGLGSPTDEKSQTAVVDQGTDTYVPVQGNPGTVRYVVPESGGTKSTNGNSNQNQNSATSNPTIYIMNQVPSREQTPNRRREVIRDDDEPSGKGFQCRWGSIPPCFFTFRKGRRHSPLPF